MSICWYCYWGWSQQVANIYKEALELLDNDEMALEYGPAHIVWGDENFEDYNIQWCLDNFPKQDDRYDDAQLEAIKYSLQELLTLPIDVRCPEPDDYDDEHPDKYPPPADIVMVGKSNFK